MARASGATPPDVAARADELATQIRYHRERYYRDDEPEISDAEFDELVRRAAGARRRSTPQLGEDDSPLAEVGAPPSATFAPVRAHRADVVARQRVRRATSSPPGTRGSSG